jgi:hypothetical protein
MTKAHYLLLYFFLVEINLFLAKSQLAYTFALLLTVFLYNTLNCPRLHDLPFYVKLQAPLRDTCRSPAHIAEPLIQ